MVYLADLYGGMREFFEAGGLVLWLIVAVSILLWSLILERYWYIYISYPRYVATMIDEWQVREDKQSWYASSIREARLSLAGNQLKSSLAFISALIGLCPLLGLLGTVTGMISVFDVMAVSGTGNARAMASGVSMATIPTMAGMVVALSGLYFRMHLKQKAGIEIGKLADRLTS